MGKTLLEKARAERMGHIKLKHRERKGELEMYVAYLQGEVRFVQVCKATGQAGGTLLQRIATLLRRAVEEGRVRVELKK